MSRKNKIQSLIIRHLMEHGTLDVTLPDGIALEIGITQMNRFGEAIKSDSYCYVSATREDRQTLLDSHNLGLKFEEKDDMFIFQESQMDDYGRPIHCVDVI